MATKRSLSDLGVCTDRRTAEVQTLTACTCHRASDSGVYQTPPAPKSLDSSFLSDDVSIFHQRDPDQMSLSSTASSTGGPSPRDRRCEAAASSSVYMPMAPSHGYSPGSSTKVSVSWVM